MNVIVLVKNIVQSPRSKYFLVLWRNLCRNRASATSRNAEFYASTTKFFKIIILKVIILNLMYFETTNKICFTSKDLIYNISLS